MRIDWHNRIKSHIGIEYLNITLYTVYFQIVFWTARPSQMGQRGVTAATRVNVTRAGPRVPRSRVIAACLARTEAAARSALTP